jgi:uncharacterized protein
MVKASPIDRRGLFAATGIPARRKIGELIGEHVSVKEARRRASRLRRIAIVELAHTGAIDATRSDSVFKYINHSCAPNTFMRRIGSHVEFYALLDIPSGAELTCDYGETHHHGKLKCRCGSGRCRGAI